MDFTALQEEMKLYEAEANADVKAAAADPAPAAEPASETPAVETAAEEAPAKVEAEEKAAPEVEKVPKTVPLAALLEERDKRANAERELAVERARREERERLQQQQQETAQQRAQREAAEASQRAQEAEERKGRPDENDDPIAAAEWDRQSEARKAQRADADERARLQNDMLRVELTSDRTSFEIKQPDYTTALNWTIEREIEDYTAMGIPRDQALFEINRRAGALIQAARQQGKSVAETFYAYAKRRGYTPATAPAVDSGASETKPAPKGPTAAEKLATADEGRKIASLGNGAGGQAPASMSDEQIDNMSSDELRAWLKTPANRKRYDRMMGATE